jgi:hypothetical protein
MNNFSNQMNCNLTQQSQASGYPFMPSGPRVYEQLSLTNSYLANQSMPHHAGSSHHNSGSHLSSQHHSAAAVAVAAAAAHHSSQRSSSNCQYSNLLQPPQSAPTPTGNLATSTTGKPFAFFLLVV